MLPGVADRRRSVAVHILIDRIRPRCLKSRGCPFGRDGTRLPTRAWTGPHGRLTDYGPRLGFYGRTAYGAPSRAGTRGGSAETRVGRAPKPRNRVGPSSRPVAARARPRPTCESFRERFRNGPVVHVPQTCCTTPHSAVLESQSGPQLHTRLTGTGHSAIRWSLRAGRLRIRPALCAVCGGDQWANGQWGRFPP